MNVTAVALLGVLSALMLTLPRRFAAIPLLFGTCYMTLAQGVELGAFSLPIFRLLLLVGVFRIIANREWPVGMPTALDASMVAFGSIVLLTAPFHQEPWQHTIFCLGFVLNTCGPYLLFRAFCQGVEDVEPIVLALAVALLPVAVSMTVEKVTQHNVFSFLGGVPETAMIRDGRTRAQGPFLHPILAGTVGAVGVPLFLGMWRRRRFTTLLGLTGAAGMIGTSTSSGPIGSVAAGLAAWMCWRLRFRMDIVRRSLVACYVLLLLVMKSPPYHLMGRLDLTGSSTGWHRVELIDSSIEHLSEWWLYGTDYTRHWMPTGVSWSPDHADITNHYVKMGVIGGLPLTLAFIATLATAFAAVGAALRMHRGTAGEMTVWALGTTLFAHAVTCISVSYFDQSIVFVYLTMALIASTAARPSPARAPSRRAALGTRRAAAHWRDAQPPVPQTRYPNNTITGSYDE